MARQKSKHEDRLRLNNQQFSVAILSAATLIFSSLVLNVASIFEHIGNNGIFIAIISPAIALGASLTAQWLKKEQLTDWLWAVFLISLAAFGNWIIPHITGFSPTMLWGLTAAFGLALAIFVNSKPCLNLSATFLIIWIWFAYTSNPPADFLWPALLLIMLGIAWDKRSKNQFAGNLFAVSLVIWTFFTAQAAMVMLPLHISQITWISCLFLVTIALILQSTQNSNKSSNYQVLILVLASAAAAGFAFSSFSQIPPTYIMQSNIVIWIILTVGLVAVSCISLFYSKSNKFDRIGILGLLILILLGIFAPLNPASWPIWLGIGTGALSIAGIWFSIRSFAKQNAIYGFSGLAIWGGSVLLGASNIENQWARITVLAIYSITAVGLYLAAERQYLTVKHKNTQKK